MVTTPTLWGGQVAFSNDPNAFGFTATGLADNNFTITWSDALGDLYGRRFDPLGSFNSTNFLFNLSNNTSQSLRLPEVIQQGNGNIKVIFSLLAGRAEEDIYIGFPNFDTAGGSGIKYEIVNTALDEFKLDAAASTFNNQPDTVIAFTKPRGTTSTRDLYIAHLAENGLPIGNPEYVPINSGESVTSAAITGLPNGNTLVAYTVFKASTSESFARYRIYDDYTDISGPRDASSTPGNDFFPAVTALERSSDGFVIATQDALGVRIFYSAFGTTFTKSVPGTLSSGGGSFPKAITPKVTALKDQGFIVAWTDTSETEGDGSPALKVGLQRFDRNGNAVGTNLFLNAPGDQSLNSIATLADGRVIVVFDSETGDSSNTFRHSYQIIDPRDGLIYGTSAADNIVGRDDGGTIEAFEGDDTLYGGAGTDNLYGGAGIDTMWGRGGGDTYIVDNAADRIFEVAGEGIDRVLSSVSYTLQAGQEIETLQLLASTGGANLSLTGNEFGQSLVGNSGANVLNGGGGADVLTGRGGNDTYLVDTLNDQVVEASGGGTDRVFASASYTLQAGQEIEGLQLLAATGSANLNLTGNEISQSLVGNNGNNVIDGGVGRDAMTGRGGNDTYLVDNLGDRVTEAAGGGTDTVLTRASYALAVGQEIEALQLLTVTGTARLNLSGNEFGQKLVGNNGANVLDGRGGADLLLGRGGADSFLFSTALGAGNVDRIADFAAEDTIRLSKSIFSAIAPGQLAGGAFKNVAAISTADLDADDRIVYKPSTGELYYDADGSGTTAAVRFAVLDNKAALTAGDFLIV